VTVTVVAFVASDEWYPLYIELLSICRCH